MTQMIIILEGIKTWSHLDNLAHFHYGFHKYGLLIDANSGICHVMFFIAKLIILTIESA